MLKLTFWHFNIIVYELWKKFCKSVQIDQNIFSTPSIYLALDWNSAIMFAIWVIYLNVTQTILLGLTKTKCKRNRKCCLILINIHKTVWLWFVTINKNMVSHLCANCTLVVLETAENQCVTWLLAEELGQRSKLLPPPRKKKEENLG